MWLVILKIVTYAVMMFLGLWILGATLRIFVIIGAIAIAVIGGVELIVIVFSLAFRSLENHTIPYGSGTVPVICDKSASHGLSKTRTRVYVSGPIKLGNKRQNCLRAISVGLQLMNAGYAPMVPHALVDYNTGRYEQWLETDFSWITVCQVVLRLPGPSEGADQEIAWARLHGIPVYTDLDKLMREVTP